MNKPNIICLTNNKGGVSKTTTTINLGYGLARAGYKTLIIDADPQSNTTLVILQNMYKDTEGTLYDIFFNRRQVKDIIIPSRQENLDIAPGSIALTNSDVALAQANAREFLLKKAMQGLDIYDFVIIDTNPNIGLITLNSWIASSSIIIPVECALFALVGMDTLINAIDIIRRDFDFELPILGVLATKYDNQTNISRNTLQTLRDNFASKVFETVIPKNVKVEEAHSQELSLYDYAPTSVGAIAYESFVKEVLDRVK